MDVEGIYRAIAAYEHAARIISERLEHTGSEKVEAVIREIRSCAAALRRENAVVIALVGADND